MYRFQFDYYAFHGEQEPAPMHVDGMQDTGLIVGSNHPIWDELAKPRDEDFFAGQLELEIVDPTILVTHPDPRARQIFNVLQRRGLV